MVKFKIDIYSHGVRVRIEHPSERRALLEYCQSLAIWDTVWSPKLKRMVKKPKAVFATANHDRDEFGFLREELPDLMMYLKGKGYEQADFGFTRHEPYPGVKVSLPLKPGVGPRDSEQEEVLEFMKSEGHRDRVLNLRTGSGKTAMALMSLAHHGRRAGLVMASGHFPTWIKDIKKFMNLDHARDICVVQGRKPLVTLIELSKAGQNDYKLIFISIATLREFIKDYLNEGYTIDGVTPYDLYQVLGIGTRVVDESHENIHALITSTIHTHLATTIYLSATLVSEDAKINQQYNRIFPQEDRFKNARDNDHIVAISMWYGLSAPDKIKYMGGKGYSHVKFEQSVLSQPTIINNYLEMIEGVLIDSFIEGYEPGQKALIFCATTEMCERVATYLSKQIKTPTLSITAYTASYDPSVLYDNDVVVSTPGSAGTGKDIPNLRTAISTVAIGSIQRNLQMLGRCRPIRDWPMLDPLYIWLTCTDIPQHVHYDNRKREQFAGKTKEIREARTNWII